MQPGVAIFIGIVVVAIAVWGVYWAVTKYKSSNSGTNTTNDTEENDGGNNTTENTNTGNDSGNINGGNTEGSGCPDVSDNVLPACEMERRREESGRTYCQRGVCGEGLEAVPDFKTAYMICVPKGKSVQEACP